MAHRISIRQKVDRELHGAIVQASETKTVPRCSHLLYDARRGRRTPVSGAIQVIDHLVAIGADANAVLMVPEVLVAYARERLAERDDPQAA